MNQKPFNWKFLSWTLLNSLLSMLGSNVVLILVLVTLIIGIISGFAMLGAILLGIHGKGCGLLEVSYGGTCAGDEEYWRSGETDVLRARGGELPSYLGITPPDVPHLTQIQQPGGYGPYDVLRGITQADYRGVIAYISVAQITAPPPVIFDPLNIEPQYALNQAIQTCISRLKERGFFDESGEGAFGLVITSTIWVFDVIRENDEFKYQLIKDVPAAYLCVGYRDSIYKFAPKHAQGIGAINHEEIAAELDRLIAAQLETTITQAYKESAFHRLLYNISQIIFGHLARNASFYHVIFPRRDIAVTATGVFRQAMFFPTPPPTPTPVPTPIPTVTPQPYP